MARGWDRGRARGYDASSNRLVCGTPPGPGMTGPGVGEGGGAFKPNTFTGLWPLDGTPPAIAVGGASFSIEAWFCWKRENELGGVSTRTIIGFVDAATISITLGAIVFYPAGATGDRAILSFGDPALETVLVSTGMGWHHLAGTFNRAGNMTLYIDAVAVAVRAIDGRDLGNCFFFALSGQEDNAAVCDLTSAEGSDLEASGVVGPVATHLGLLTPAQIGDSFRGKRVQNLATTAVNYDWRGVEGHTGWETDVDRIIAKARENLETLGVAAPIGVNGTVTVPDLSGNGNDWALPTAEVYGTDTADKATIGFLSQPFWMS